MKKFIVLSTLVAVAGLGVGIAGRQGSDPQVVEAAAPGAVAETSPTTAPAAPAAAQPTATTRPVAVKAAAKVTATTARPAASPTTATTAAPVATTTTRPAAATTTMAAPPAAPASTCSMSQEGQAVRMTSNLPSTPFKMIAVYPADPNSMNKIPQQFVRQGTTDASGGDLWSPVPSVGTGAARVSVSFYPAGARSLSSLCSTTFQP